MTATTIHSTARAKQWDDRFFMEYVRASRFRRYMGTNENSVIQVNERLTARKGDRINCPLVGALRGTHNNGTTQLVGNEKPLHNYAWGTEVRTVRDAVVVDMDEEQASPFDIRQASRRALRDLSMDYLKNHTIAAMDDRTGSHNIAEGTGGMTADQWDAANADRVMYGEAKSAGTGFQSQLDAISSGSKMTAATVRTAKALAKTAGGALSATGRGNIGRIRPIRVAEDEEWYVLFVSTENYQNLQGDATISGANREAWQRYGGNARDGGQGGNPLYRGGDLVYDGVIIREITEINELAALGSTGLGGAGTVDRAFMCGAQAITYAWAQRTRTTLRKEDDYGYQYGVGFNELRGVSKVHWEKTAGTELLQWGMVSIYTGK